MKASGKAISLAPFSAASLISPIDLSIEASRSSQAGAACTTATLYFGCWMPIAASLCSSRTGRFPVECGSLPMQSIGPEPDEVRSTATARKFDWNGGTEFASRCAGPVITCEFGNVKRRPGHVHPVQHRWQPEPPAALALAGHRLRRIRRARLQIGPGQRISRLGYAGLARQGDLLRGLLRPSARLSHALAHRTLGPGLRPH